MIRYEENDGFPIDKSCVNDRMPGAVFNVGLREADGLIQVRARGYITATGDPAETGELVDFAAPSVSLSVLGQRGSSVENEISSGTIGVINGESRLIRIFATDRVIYSTGFALVRRLRTKLRHKHPALPAHTVQKFPSMKGWQAQPDGVVLTV